MVGDGADGRQHQPAAVAPLPGAGSTVTFTSDCSPFAKRRLRDDEDLRRAGPRYSRSSWYGSGGTLTTTRADCGFLMVPASFASSIALLTVSRNDSSLSQRAAIASSFHSAGVTGKSANCTLSARAAAGRNCHTSSHVCDRIGASSRASVSASA